MKRYGLLLILLALFMAACGSNQAERGGQAEIEGPDAEATVPSVPNETEEEIAESPEEEIEAAGPTDTEEGDPTQARARDWKLGNLVDPIVTIIEYGDFQ